VNFPPDEHGSQNYSTQHHQARRGGETADADERNRVADNDPAILQADESDEQADAGRNRQL
jgi:hypothetical protein